MAEFIMQINGTFVILNSKTLCDKNPNSQPLSNTTDNSFRTLKNICNMFLQINKLNKNKK